MANPEKRCGNDGMTINVRGHEVLLLFAETANPRIALQVKQALLGTYLTADKLTIEADNIV